MSFSIEENSVFGLVGNNGAGKTTLLRLLVGLLKPVSGTIKLFGEKLTRKRDQLWRIRQRIGFLFQNPDDQLFAPTIFEDVSFGARNMGLSENEVEKRSKWALEAVGLWEYKDHSPFHLSWGQKKRACLAGLLVMRPQLLILDEPFANLDNISIYNHFEILERLRKQENMTILFTSHNLLFVKHWADKILVLNNGNSLYEGPTAQGFENPEVTEFLGSYEKIIQLIDHLKHKA